MDCPAEKKTTTTDQFYHVKDCIHEATNASLVTGSSHKTTA